MLADESMHEPPKLVGVAEKTVDEKLTVADVLKSDGVRLEQYRRNRQNCPLLRFHDAGDVLHRLSDFVRPRALSVRSGAEFSIAVVA